MRTLIKNPATVQDAPSRSRAGRCDASGVARDGDQVKGSAKYHAVSPAHPTVSVDSYIILYLLLISAVLFSGDRQSAKQFA